MKALALSVVLWADACCAFLYAPRFGSALGLATASGSKTVASRPRVALTAAGSPTPDAGDPFETEMERAKREARDLDELIRGRHGASQRAVELEWAKELDKAMINFNVGISGARVPPGTYHAVYRNLEEIVTGASERIQSVDHVEIMQRCQEYDPEKAFVVVFGHKGLLGVQIYQPSTGPRNVYNREHLE